MESPVKIKSYNSGITVILDPEMEFNELTEKVKNKFIETGSFFRKAKLAIGFEGRKLSDEEEKELLKMITEISEIQVICVIGRDEETENIYMKAVHQIEKEAQEKEEEAQKNKENDSLLHKGDLRKGESIESDANVVVLGDVCQGASIISAKDIMIFGKLFGKVHAGAKGEFGHRVFALEMAPEELKIGELQFDGKLPGSKWGIHPKVQPKTAFQDQDKISIELYGGK